MMQLELNDIISARARIAPHIRKTPLMAAAALSAPITDARLWLKLECLQASGSFKARGATNKLLSTPRDALAQGVVTASGGNHALATVRAASSAGVKATIFVPENVAAYKLERLRAMGATVHVVGSVWNETNEHALAFATKTGAAYFHPFADPAVMAGQGTVALEILDELPDLDAILIAIGGGGLLTGMAVALKTLKPSIRIIGIEPVGCPTFHASLAAGQVITLPKVSTRVATMACARTDPDVFELSRHLIDDIILLEDRAMEEAARWLWTELGLAADLSGAAAVAALRGGHVALTATETVCALVCGAGTEGIPG
ncbi:threonine/serine dehydratase [Hoeflea sp. YIM 152468]|uniref:threonine ammonia-lyase n=1 Tax=Hoeflea sp. YIM 152468 TaxID=3031759 RepID=UPI0023DC0DB4|nr:threonine/serine dehydratase [Hoeflea sp. YIM 152468]MDF1608944.1 threonine/serine dehydratase [Hoeflea sp. YIM 152468]